MRQNIDGRKDVHAICLTGLVIGMGRYTIRRTPLRTAKFARRFADALLNPRKPDEGLRAAARRYMEAIGN